MAHKLSQVGLAEKVERTTETISNIERGVSSPTIETLERLSGALRVPMREFFEGSDGQLIDRKRLQLEFEIRGLLAQLSMSDLEVARKQLLALTAREE